MDLGLRDATAVVIGGGRGMGLATARCLAEDGARVAVVGRSVDVVEEVAVTLTECGSPEAFGLVADTADQTLVDALFDDVAQRIDPERVGVIRRKDPRHQIEEPVARRIVEAPIPPEDIERRSLYRREATFLANRDPEIV